MSYDIYLNDPVTGERLHASQPHQFTGGTYVDGGTTELWLNVTYNYGPHFYRVLGEQGIRSIYGTTGAASLPVLAEAAAKLDSTVDPDYWAPTEGNARKALLGLAQLALLAPHGVWDGD